MNILHLESSPRGSKSHSRQIAQQFVTALQSRTGATIAYRDLNNPAIPHVSGTFVEAAVYAVLAQRSITPEEQEALQLSDELVAELREAEVVVLAMPMYNWTVPSVTKAYIDHIIRPMVTMGYDKTGPHGLLTGKKMYVVTTRGGSGYEDARAHVNFADNYLRTAFGFVGINDMNIIGIENNTVGGEAWDSALEKARTEIAGIVASF